MKSGKYRIVKVSDLNGLLYYKVQYKGLFFGWNDETYFDCCIDGNMAYNYTYQFKSIIEAEIYINKQFIKEEICKIV